MKELALIFITYEKTNHYLVSENLFLIYFIIR